MQTRMIEWAIAKDHQYQIDTGGHGKRFKENLSAELYHHWEKTVSDAQITHIWDSVFASITLFSILAKAVCEGLNLSYPEHEEILVTAHLKRLQKQQKTDQ